MSTTSRTSSHSLCSIPPRRVAQVLSVKGSEDEQLRLGSLGICPGRKLQVMKCSDPLILCVMETRVGLSRQLAGNVEVALGEETD